MILFIYLFYYSLCISIYTFLCSDSLLYTSFFFFLLYIVFIHVIVHGYSPNHSSRSWRSFKLKLANIYYVSQNTALMLVYSWAVTDPRLRVHILLRKLALLGKLIHSDGVKLSSRVFHTLAAENVYKISLAEQCQFLESELGTTFTAKCLNDPENSSSIVAEAKEELVKKDWHLLLKSINSHSSLQHVSSPVIASSWCKVWDHALDHGVRGTKLMQSLFIVMSRLVVGDIPVTRLYRGKMNSNTQTRYLSGNHIIVHMCKSVSSHI